jgi:hypothetical protein
MLNEFNYLTLRELYLIRIRHFDYLDPVQKFKVMWAIDRANKTTDKARKKKSVNRSSSFKAERNEITLGSRDSDDVQANFNTK